MRNAQTVLSQCPYCLGAFPDAEMTDDHVIARSWFPAGTPPVAKWQVRACQPCNNRKSALERDVLGRLAWCLDPKRSDLAHHSERSPVDRSSICEDRAGFHASLQSAGGPAPLCDRRRFEERSRPSALFHRQLRRRLTYGNGGAAAVVGRLVQMWVRGIHLYEIRRMIPSEYEVSVIHADDELRTHAFSGVMEHAKIIQKGPGVEVKIFHAEQPEEFMTVYAFNIWNALKCSAAVERAA